MNHLSLFTGIGGIDLAAEWAGFRTVGQVEFADYPTKVLEKNFPNIPRWRRIQDVTGAEVKRTIGNRHIDLISGGFPCQPFSVAGKKKGKNDDRHLWPEMFRVIQELQPTWVIGENVAGFVSMALEETCVDLENSGYEVQSIVIPACAVNAWHQRKRVFIIAHSTSKSTTGYSVGEKKAFSMPRKYSSDVPDTNDRHRTLRRYGQLSTASQVKRPWSHNGRGKEEYVSRKWWSTEPGVGRVANGIPSRVDRLRCLGNAVVPQQIYPILKAIADQEE